MEKLNIAEILKDCPKGMELDCIMYDNVKLIDVDEREEIVFPIRVVREDGITDLFTKYGQYIDSDFAKCVIFPKGKTTWEGFQRPFKDGDVIYIQSLYEYIVIYKKTNCKNLYKHAAICISFNNRLLSDNNILCCEEDVKKIRFATEEEKQKLFDTIKANGYKWNPETKTLEKLIEPKFGVTDKIGKSIDIKEQGNYELVPNKFDITTLKPFESRVLVRTNNRKWVAAFYSHYDKDSLFTSLHGWRFMV